MKTFSLITPALLLAGLLLSCNGDRAENKRSMDATTKSDSVVSSSYATGNSAPGYTSDESKNKSFDALVQETAQQKEEADKQLDANNAFFPAVFSSSAARVSALDSLHRFIRTADIRFRVRDVVSSTYAIENITLRFGGYVANTHLSSDNLGTYTTRISEDSSLETMHFQVTNQLVLRIPVANLDTTLKSLVPLIDFLDYRNVTTNDITLDLLANQLQQKRQSRYSSRMGNDIDAKGKHLDDVQNAEQSIRSSQEQSDNALLENLRLDDQVRYSTITLNIYQHEAFRQEVVKNEKTISAYEPGLGDKLANAAGNGWRGLRFLLVIIVTLWPLWLVAGVTWFFVRRLIRRKKKETAQ